MAALRYSSPGSRAFIEVHAFKYVCRTERFHVTFGSYSKDETLLFEDTVEMPPEGLELAADWRANLKRVMDSFFRERFAAEPFGTAPPKRRSRPRLSEPPKD